MGPRLVRRYFFLCALCATLQLVAPAEAKVRDCPSSPNENLFGISTRDMSCSAALSQIRRVHYVGTGYAPRLAGWQCRTVTRHVESAEYRCARRAQAFRWDRGA
jgi:hypothetical protein